jgi:hypothetical protein
MMLAELVLPKVDVTAARRRAAARGISSGAMEDAA